MDAHQRWIPLAMLAGAALHLAIGLADPRTRKLVDAGPVAALDGDPGREAILWLLALGLAFAALAEVTRWSVRATGRLPTRLGEWLVGIGALIVAVAPASGGWLVLGLGDGRCGPSGGGPLRAPSSGPGVEVSAIRPSITGDDLRRPGRQDD
jgi:Family of unknown function (DUF6463)